MSDCPDRLQGVVEKIRWAALRVQRNPREITLIAVSKQQPRARVEELISAGHRDFGESTLQDAKTKIPFFESSGVIWHFIGHLQTNKAKFAARHFTWIHSLDSMKLAAGISDAAAQAGRRVNVLLQVNITHDPGKFGVPAQEVSRHVEDLLKAELPGIQLQGLMTIGPQGAGRSELQRAFGAMRALQENCAREFGPQWFKELSMGMSGDFEVAVAEGATMVRVGTAIFGARE